MAAQHHTATAEEQLPDTGVEWSAVEWGKADEETAPPPPPHPPMFTQLSQNIPSPPPLPSAWETTASFQAQHEGTENGSIPDRTVLIVFPGSARRLRRDITGSTVLKAFPGSSRRCQKDMCKVPNLKHNHFHHRRQC